MNDPIEAAIRAIYTPETSGEARKHLADTMGMKFTAYMAIYKQEMLPDIEEVHDTHRHVTFPDGEFRVLPGGNARIFFDFEELEKYVEDNKVRKYVDIVPCMIRPSTSIKW